MSLSGWGKFLESFRTTTEARQFIADCNNALAHMDLSNEVKMSIEFHIKPTYDNTQGRNWYHGVYMRIEEHH
jgi:hypothetical protein